MANGSTCVICRVHVVSSSYCSACGASFCDQCWDSQIAHRLGSMADAQHERSDREVTMRLQSILTPARDPELQRKLHREDLETTWLRYVKGTLQEPELHEDSRYNILMQQSLTLEWEERWPQLISFIGQTGLWRASLAWI